jgi:hypothetical protein
MSYTGPIRLSPSGPEVASIGAGFRLRMAQEGGSVSTLAVTTGAAPILPAGAGDFIVSLANPRPERQYLVNAHFMAEKLSSTTGALTVALQSRLTVAGVTGAWATLRANTVSGVENQIGLVTEVIDQPMALGSALLTPIVADTDLLEVRVVCSAAGADLWEVPNGGDNGNFLLSLEELN